MTGWSMVCSVLSTYISVGCVVSGLVALRYGLGRGSDDEISSLFVLVAFVTIAPAILFGYYGCAESWIVVGVTSSFTALVYLMRSILEKAH